MIRIESNMTHALDVRLTPPGYSPARFLTIPAASQPTGDGEPGSPGVVEVEEIDVLTLQRLRHHYDWRPSDSKNAGKKREDLGPDDVVDIGLLRFSDVKGKGGKKRATEDETEKAA